MCEVLSSDLYCTNFKCPHNLFWEELRLDRDKVQMTDKALEIRNCCCRIIHPWTPEEISEAWGLTKEAIRESEEEAFRKLQKKIGINKKRPLSTRTLNTGAEALGSLGRKALLYKIKKLDIGRGSAEDGSIWTLYGLQIDP